MTIQEARETVILSGKKLVESGLIARTWGNVSCRISSTHFVITPSGRDYMSLTPDEIVEVAISDCSYSGGVKPSSEKGIHAEVYRLHPEINFVIHTHQEYASAVSALSIDSINVSEDFPSLCGQVICAAYGLPGTKKLRRGVAAALSCSKGNAVIMKNHGALCFGRNYEEAFKVAQELESACINFIRSQYLKLTCKPDMDTMEMSRFALSRLIGNILPENVGSTYLPCASERTEGGFKMYIGAKVFDMVSDLVDSTLPHDDSISAEIQIHNEIYKNHSNINNMVHVNTLGIAAVSCAGLKLLPLLDDFAQIAGTSVKTVEMDALKISSGLKDSSSIFIQGNGALCCGNSRGDALAVSMVAEKNCKALIGAALFGKVKYINRFECILMRFVYLKKYSKQAHIK